MSAPLSDHLATAASTTSSGFADGLGRRALGFDREEGTMLERLTVRPELAAFESQLRERVDRLAAIEDERIARPRWIERDSDGGVVVVSEFVPGSRLSDLLDVSAEQTAAPGLDAALGYLLDVLPALCGLHAGAGFAHGAITPSRTVLTPAGQVVLLDSIYGGALSLLRFSRRTLWMEFGIAAPASAGAPRLDVEADIAQVTLAGMMLVLGRPLYEDEFPDALPRIMADVIDVSQIRGGAAFTEVFQSFLRRALPLPGRRPYAAADDALIDVRTLAGQLGLDACRRALVDFIEQMEPSGRQESAEPAFDDVLADITTYGTIESIEAVDVDDEVDEDEDAAEIDLEELVEEPSYHVGRETDKESSSPPGAGADTMRFDSSEGLDRAQQHAVGAPRTVHAQAFPPASTPAHAQQHVSQPLSSAHGDAESSSTEAEHGDDSSSDAAGLSPSSVRAKRAKRTRSARARKDKLRSAATPTPLATQKSAPESKAPQPPASAASKVTSSEDEKRSTSPAAPASKTDEGQRAERPEAVEKREKTERAPDAEKPQPRNWLVPPGRAAAFEPAVPDSPAAVPLIARPPAPPVAPAAFSQPAPAIPFAPIAPPAPIPIAPPAPPAAPLPMPTFNAPAPWAPPQPPAPPFPAAGPAIAAPSAPLKLKEPPPRPRARPPAPIEDIYSTPLPPITSGDKSGFPWKLAAGALVAVTILIVAGRSLMPTSTPDGEGITSAAEATAPGSSAPRANSSKPTPTNAAAGVPSAGAAAGRIEIETQPAGAQILLDGKPVGQSPLALDSIPAGRHTLTFTAASGSVKRIVRVENGRTLKVDVPIFSGWVGIFAPFVVVVSEGDRVIGTTEESRLMLSPGRHVLTLTNRELGYRAVETVEIEPGEVRSITLDPRGTVNLNASPWAEVWIDGKKAGDTPLAGLQLPLGTQEITFRHPQYGERKATVTVKGNQPIALSVNMMK